MDAFFEALVSEKTMIPKEYDWFEPLLGDWDFDYTDGLETDAPRRVRGEWLFRRVLEGAGIGDLFICPSRAAKEWNPQPDGEYGLAMRMFNEQEKRYDMTYTQGTVSTRLAFRMEGERLVGTVLERPEERWVFSEMTPDTFRWRNITALEDGNERVNSEIRARRKRA